MMKRALKVIVVLLSVLVPALPSYATNGDNLIGIGPVSRAMGGVGIAKPLDAIGAVFANPAAMCFGDYCPASELNFHLGYMHAFEETITETGTDITGQPVTLASTLSEDSIDVGFTWRF